MFNRFRGKTNEQDEEEEVTVNVTDGEEAAVETTTTTTTTPVENSDWKMAEDDKGKTYYHNIKTKETSWEKPPGFIEPSKSAMQRLSDAKNAAKRAAVEAARLAKEAGEKVVDVAEDVGEAAAESAAGKRAQQVASRVAHSEAAQKAAAATAVVGAAAVATAASVQSSDAGQQAQQYARTAKKKAGEAKSQAKNKVKEAKEKMRRALIEKACAVAESGIDNAVDGVAISMGKDPYMPRIVIEAVDSVVDDVREDAKIFVRFGNIVGGVMCILIHFFGADSLFFLFCFFFFSSVPGP